MKIDQKDNLLTILLTDNEQFDKIDSKPRNHYGKETQIWIRITEKDEIKN